MGIIAQRCLHIDKCVVCFNSCEIQNINYSLQSWKQKLFAAVFIAAVILWYGYDADCSRKHIPTMICYHRLVLIVDVKAIITDDVYSYVINCIVALNWQHLQQAKPMLSGSTNYKTECWEIKINMSTACKISVHHSSDF